MANEITVNCPHHYKEEQISWPYGDTCDADIPCGDSSAPGLLGIRLSKGKITKVKKIGEVPDNRSKEILDKLSERRRAKRE